MQNLMTVKQIVAEVPAFTLGGIRNLLFYDTDQFRTRCSIKVGSKVMLDAAKVEEWLDDHRQQAA